MFTTDVTNLVDAQWKQVDTLLLFYYGMVHIISMMASGQLSNNDLLNKPWVLANLVNCTGSYAYYFLSSCNT